VAKRRIMLARLQPRVTAAPTFATLNANDKGGNIVLSSGNLVASNSSATTHKVRGSIAMTRGSWYWETHVTTGSSSANRCGIARATELLTSAPAIGTGPLNAGVDYTTGNYYYNGSLIGTLGAAGAGNTVGHSFDASTGTYRVRKNNGAWATVVTALANVPWYPCLEVPQSNAQGINFGASALAHKEYAGAHAGLWRNGTSATTSVFVSSEAFVGGDDGKGGPAIWRPRIAGDADVVIERAAMPWPFSGDGQSRRGSITLLNGDRRLDEWLGWEWRDAAYTIWSGYVGQAFEDFVVWASGVVDDIVRDGTRRIVLPLADPLVRLDRPMQTTVYPTSAANAQVIGALLPIAIGQALYCPGILRSTATIGADAFSFDYHDRALRSIDAIYDRGDVLTVTTDYGQLPARTGAKLVNDPDRPVCANVTGETETLSTLVPASGVASDFATASWSGSPSAPPGWQVSLSGTSSVTKVSGGARLTCAGVPDQAELSTVSSLLPLNGLIRVDIDVSAYTSGTLAVRRGIAAIFGTPVINSVGRWTLFGQNSTAGALRLFVSGVASDITVRSVVATTVSVIERLPAWMRYLCVTRGGLTTGDLDTTAIAALDTAAPYRLAHYTDRAQSILAVLRMTLDSYCGWVTTNRVGQVTVGRLESRADRTGTLVLNTSNIISIRQRKDIARGFTRRLAGRRNHRPHSPGEIASGVSAALRAELQAEWTCIRSASPAGEAATLASEPMPTSAARSGIATDTASAYVHGDGNAPQPTLLQEPAQIQSEISRVDAIFANEEVEWYEVEALLAAATADQVELGQFASVTYPIEGLEGGRWLVILGAVLRFRSRRMTLTMLKLPEAA
jgi:hypothetical protein